MKNTTVLTGNLYTTFAKYVSLNVMSMLAFSFYILADTFFIANSVGADGLVALNLVLPVFSILNGLGALLGIGGATRYSILRGSGDKQKADRIFTQIFAITIGIGVILTVLFLSLNAPILRLLGADDQVFGVAKQYYISLLSFSLFFILNHVMSAFVKNDGAPRLAMIAMLSSSIFNVVFDYILMYPLKMGMMGAALASGIAPILSILILSCHFIKGKSSFKLIKTKFHAVDIRKSLSSGIAPLISELNNGIIILAFNLVILRIAGNIGVGAYSVIANLALVGASIFNGLGQGIQPIVSANYGAGNHKRVAKVWVLTCTTAISLGVLYYLICYFLRYPLVGLFNKDKLPELTDLAVNGMIIYNIAFILMGIGVSSGYFLASIAKPQFATLTSLLRGVLLPIPLVLTIPMALGLTGVWITVPIAEAITAATALLIVTLYVIKNIKKPKLQETLQLAENKETL